MSKKINIKKAFDRPALGIVLLVASAALLTAASLFNIKSNTPLIIALLATISGIVHIIWHIRNNSRY